VETSLIIFFVSIIYFTFRGYKSGLLAIASRLISLLAAYAITYLFVKPFAQWLQTVSPIEGLISYAIGGLLLFILTSAVLSILFKITLNIFAQKDSLVGRTSSVLGGLLGASVGVIVGISFVWFYTTMYSLYQTKKGIAVDPTTPFQQQIKIIAGTAVETIVSGVTKQKELAMASAALLTNPAESLERFKSFSESGLMQSFLKDGSAQYALDSRNAKAVLQHPSFQKTVNQEDFIALSKQFGFSDKKEDMQKQMAIKMTTLWTQIDRIKEDPEFKRITNSPEVKSMLNSKDVYAMLKSDEIEKLFSLISSVETPKITFDDNISSDKMGRNNDAETKIYQWTDERGRVHYSDKENETEED